MSVFCVPLHLVEEVWQLLDETTPVPATHSGSDDDDELMALSKHVVQGTSAAHTLKFPAFV